MKRYRQTRSRRLGDSLTAPERRSRRRAFPTPAVIAALGLLLFPGCDLFQDDSGGGSKKIKRAPFTTTQVVVPGDVVSSTVSLVDMSADVPQDSLAMGAVVTGTADSSNIIVIEHAGVIFGGDDNITGPDGAVPLSFNTINGDPSPSTINTEAVAVHFPNDGRGAKLDAGTYRFPVVAYNPAGTSPVVDTLGGFVYYKTKTEVTPTLKLNVFVLNGIAPGITSQAQAAADPEILGAVSVLRNVYGNNEEIGVNVDISVQYLNDAASANCLAVSAGEISTEAEQYCLLSSYPTTPTHDAMNIFVISSLDYIDPNNPGAGVIGLASGIPGPFNRQGLATSGTLAEYQGDNLGTILGFTLAHEFGHFLGLFHTSQTSSSATSIVGEDPISDTKLCETAQVRLGLDECPDFGNLMFPFVSVDPDPPVSTGQGNVVKYNPGITVP